MSADGDGARWPMFGQNIKGEGTSYSYLVLTDTEAVEPVNFGTECGSNNIEVPSSLRQHSPCAPEQGGAPNGAQVLASRAQVHSQLGHDHDMHKSVQVCVYVCGLKGRCASFTPALTYHGIGPLFCSITPLSRQNSLSVSKIKLNAPHPQLSSSSSSSSCLIVSHVTFHQPCRNVDK